MNTLLANAPVALNEVEIAANAIMQTMFGRISRANAVRCASAALNARGIGTITSLGAHGFPDYGYTDDLRVIRITPSRGTKVGREIKPFIDVNGYTIWNLRKSNGEQSPLRRSVLACTHYHGTRPAGMLALHGDGNPQNDSRENLRWGTPAQNMADMVRHGRAGRTRGLRHGSRTKPLSVCRGEGHGMAKLSRNQVRAIRASQQNGPDLSRQYGVSVSRINQIKRGEGWQL